MSVYAGCRHGMLLLCVSPGSKHTDKGILSAQNVLVRATYTDKVILISAEKKNHNQLSIDPLRGFSEDEKSMQSRNGMYLNSSTLRSLNVINIELLRCQELLLQEIV